MKKIFAVLLLLPIYAIDIQAGDDYSRLLRGRWKITGVICTKGEDCTRERKRTLQIEFLADGKARVEENEKPADFTYRIQGSSMILKNPNGDELTVEIILLDRDTLIMELDDIRVIKMARVDDSGKQDEVDPETEKNMKLISGRWQVAGAMCDDSGNCRETIKEDITIDFNPDGTGTVTEDGDAEDFFYKIEKNAVTLIDSRGRKESITILKLTEDVFLYNAKKARETNKLTRIRPDSEKFSERITGKWKLIATDCSVDGDCKKTVDAEYCIEFSKNGKGTSYKSGSVVHSFSYTINGDIITVTDGRLKWTLRILLLDEKTIIWENQEDQEIQKLTRMITATEDAGSSRGA